ncbi:MAG: N-acetylmuramoyl-L-alanine amidase [Bacteroidia bacterium]|nr:N-acetylmuramoyl-L-alanine amidase [Bacteroidia bacterium]
MKLISSIICAVLLSTAVSAAPGHSAPGPSDLGLHVVVIDPGHGGKDAGCISKDKKTYEKQLVLNISKRLKEKIEAANPDVKVYLTRDSDVYKTLSERAQFATDKGADLFISVHINANDKTAPNGYSVHLLGQSTDKNKDTYAFNMDVCKRENEVILLEDDYSTTYQGFDPNDPESDIFLHLMHNAYREQSLIFAQLVDQKLSGGPIKKSNGVLQNNFQVLRQASMPAALLEIGFISNTTDLGVLRSSDQLDRISTRIASAFKEYKTIYDESVGAAGTQTAAKAQPKAEDKQAPAAAATPAANGGAYYGTQVLASSKSMKADDPYFLGYKMEYVKSGNLYKYIIGISDDVDKAREISKEIRKKYSDAFLVKVDDSGCTRVK